MAMPPTGKRSLPEVPLETIVRVGDGRGFIVGTDNFRVTVTAAHCVPSEIYPPPHLSNSSQELFRRDLIRRRARRANKTVWAEFCALSLIDDIAAFGTPDDQDCPSEPIYLRSSPRQCYPSARPCKCLLTSGRRNPARQLLCYRSITSGQNAASIAMAVGYPLEALGSQVACRARRSLTRTATRSV
jgi:hypothetical protein